MKNQFLLIGAFILIQMQAYTQSPKCFNTELFDRLLRKEMESQFPGLSFDSTLYFATKAINQIEAGNPTCYGTKKGGMVNTAETEMEQAQLLVWEYKNYLQHTLHLNSSAISRCHFTEYCSSVVSENGLVRYGLIIDNNIDFRK
jgi:hypothetical protein